MFYLNTIVQLYLLVEQLDQLEVCLSNSRLLTEIPFLVVFQNLRWNSNKTSVLDTILCPRAINDWYWSPTLNWPNCCAFLNIVLSCTFSTMRLNLMLWLLNQSFTSDILLAGTMMSAGWPSQGSFQKSRLDWIWKFFKSSIFSNESFSVRKT